MSHILCINMSTNLYLNSFAKTNPINKEHLFQIMKKSILLLLVFLISLSSFGQKKDKEEKNFKFAGIPLLGYNRTIGFSLGALLNSYYKVNQQDTISPSSSTSLIGVYTTNNSYFGAFIQQFFLKEDIWRIKLIGGFGNANLQVYPEFGDAGDYIDYSSLVKMGSIDVKRKVYNRFYAGLSASLMNAETTFDYIDPSTGDYYVDKQTLNNVGVNLLYDNRDNVNYPTKGLHVFMNNQFFSDGLGNDSSFVKIEFSYNFYFNFKSEKRVMLLRYYSKSSIGEVPFQGYNTVRGDDIRGYSKGDHRDKQIYSYQAEYRHRFENKFGFVAFVGIAAAVPDMMSLLNAQYLPGIGIGLRYLIIKKEKINLGIDVAVGRNDWSLTFRVGEAFSR